MAYSLTSTLTFSNEVSYTSTTGVSTNAVELVPATPLLSATLSNGTGNNQGNVYYEANRSVAATTNDDLDLSGGLTDPFGRSITMTALKKLVVVNNSASYTFQIGGAATNPISTLFANTSDILVIPPSSAVALYAPLGGWAITAGSADVLRVRNAGAGTADYNIIMEGVM